MNVHRKKEQRDEGHEQLELGTERTDQLWGHTMHGRGDYYRFVEESSRWLGMEEFQLASKMVWMEYQVCTLGMVHLDVRMVGRGIEEVVDYSRLVVS